MEGAERLYDGCHWQALDRIRAYAAYTKNLRY